MIARCHRNRRRRACDSQQDAHKQDTRERLAHWSTSSRRIYKVLSEGKESGKALNANTDIMTVVGQKSKIKAIRNRC
jgi:hypothetical protein